MSGKAGELSKWPARAASLLGWALAAWLAFRPNLYEAAVAANILAPLVFLGLAARWPGRFRIFDVERGRLGFDTVNGLVAGPAFALLFRQASDFHAIDEAAGFGWGVGLGALLTGIYWLIDRKLDDAERFVGLIIAVLWGAGAVLMANFALDRSPGVVHVTEVTGKRTSSRGGSWLDLRRLDGAPPLVTLPIDRAELESVQVGDRRCVEINPGLFDWRRAAFVDCPRTG